MRMLRWGQIAQGRHFHAAMVHFAGRNRTEMHTHDFAEIMYVLAGGGAHPINETSQEIKEGDLLFIRPQDRHGIRPLPGETLTFINIAFPDQAWAEFVATAGLGGVGASWASAPLPLSVTVPIGNREQVAHSCHRILRAYAQKPTRLELVGFWVEASRQLVGTIPIFPEEAGPDWLAGACRAMREEHNLSEGLPRLLELSGVSAGHLSRAMRRHRGQTPTDFLNDLRLDRAATLLSTTPHEIIAISNDCGFGSLSYFYRIFHQRFGETPAQYRARILRSIAP